MKIRGPFAGHVMVEVVIKQCCVCPTDYLNNLFQKTAQQCFENHMGKATALTQLRTKNVTNEVGWGTKRKAEIISWK